MPPAECLVDLEGAYPRTRPPAWMAASCPIRQGETWSACIERKVREVARLIVEANGRGEVERERRRACGQFINSASNTGD